jgi:hypothetical protein
MSSGANPVASRNTSNLRRWVAVALLGTAGGGFWLSSEADSTAMSGHAKCTPAPCVAETTERLDAPVPVERARRPAAPSLDWRSLLPAGILRPR